MSTAPGVVPGLAVAVSLVLLLAAVIAFSPAAIAGLLDLLRPRRVIGRVDQPQSGERIRRTF